MPFDIAARKTGVTRSDTYDFGADVAKQDVNFDRYMAYIKTLAETQTVNPDGTTSPPTDAQAHRRYWRGIMRGLRDQIKRHELVTAQAAVPQPEDITVA